jgi:8-hydroxy-5-deazaflavin:NADPH oxidoreductase
MKISVLGTGVVGQTIAEKLSQLGHDVMISTRNVQKVFENTATDRYGRPSFKEWSSANSNIKVGTHAEAGTFGEMIVNATNGAGSLEALEAAGKKNLENKIVIDIANPLDFSKGMPPSLFVCNTDSLGEQIQRTFPLAKVVKTLNTMNTFIMVNPALLAEDHNVFVSGNDGDSKSEVKALLKSFGWKTSTIIDLGDITTSRGTEQLLPIWIRLYGSFQHAMFNFKIVMSKS